MVRQKATNLKKRTSASNRSTSTTTTPTSTSMTRTPTRQSREESGTSTVERTEKKKRGGKTFHMRVGAKIFKIGQQVIREIKQCQTSTSNLIPKLPFARLVQEIMLEFMPGGGCIQKIALEALQEAAETYIVQYLEDSYICTLHDRRCTLIPRDMEVVKSLRHSSASELLTA